MNREEALSLLDELLVTFETVKGTPIVFTAQVEKSQDWELQVKWLVGNNEKALLTDFALKHGLTMREEKDCTLFR
ncbi:MAG: hypothetical protein ABSE15_06740 [Candidatus Bathyarchaeia archaeon]